MMTDQSSAAHTSEPIPGPDPGACPKCGQWRKAGMLHDCPGDTAASPSRSAPPAPSCPSCGSTDTIEHPRAGRWDCLSCKTNFRDPPAASPSPHVVFGLDSPREILDACCGGRMWWWDKEHPLAIYMDVREAPRGSVGELTGRPEWNPNWSCEPTCKGDFRNMPFEDDSFQLVVFDPPHVTREKQPPEGINGLKYGALHPATEQEDLRLGFAECWRVLRPGGTLVFKWGAGSIKRVELHFPATPIVGTRSPRGGQTRWFIFYKPLDGAALEAVA